METEPKAWLMLLEAGLPVLIGTAVAAAALIVALFPLLQRYALARPNARSSHKVPTPQGGGIAVAAAMLAGTLAAAGWRDGGAALLGNGPLLAVIAATLMLAVLGLVDDLRPLEALPRLAVQAIAVALVIVSLPAELHLLPWLPLAVERALAAVALVWFVNLVNFMDGIDWMSVAELVPVTFGLALMAALGALAPAEGLAALALGGAMLGFAPFNRPVARLFLGDVGSLPIGLWSGWLLVALAARGYLAAALLLPLYYLADATITLLRRLARGERVWQAHRTHFYQRACDHGFSVGAITTTVFAANIGLLMLAVSTVLWPNLAWQTVSLVLGALLVGCVLFRFSRPWRAAPAPTRV